MTKKLIFGLVILALVAVPVFSACAAKPTAGVIDLIVNDHNPGGPPVLAIDYWAKYVNDNSGGRLNLKVIHGGALFTGVEEYRALKSGACDISYYVVDREQGFLLSTVITLPFMGWAKQHEEAKFYTLMDEFPAMKKEWEGVTIIGLMMMPFTHLHFSAVNKVVKTPADIKGVKIMCAEATNAKILNAVGGTAVELDIADMAPSLQTKLVDGVFNHFPVLGVFGALEFLKSHTIFGSGGAGINNTPMYLLMNTAKLNSLPKDLQTLILDSGKVWVDKFSELDAADITNSMGFCTKNNHTMTYLTPQEVAVWRDATKTTINDAWIKEANAAGLPGQKVYDRCLELAAQK